MLHPASDHANVGNIIVDGVLGGHGLLLVEDGGVVAER
jgi:hypothetical protein